MVTRCFIWTIPRSVVTCAQHKPVSGYITYVKIFVFGCDVVM